MQTKSRPQATQRLQRIILWTALALAWAGEVVAGAMKRFRAGRKLEAHLAAFVPRLAQIVARILLAEALILHDRHFIVHTRFRTRAQKIRALIGPAIRRLMRGRTLAETIARLAHVVRHRAAIVRRIVTRIARGLTQAHVFRAHLETTPALAACVCTPARRDSS